MASAEPAETPQPSVWGRATKRVTLPCVASALVQAVGYAAGDLARAKARRHDEPDLIHDRPPSALYEPRRRTRRQEPPCFTGNGSPSGSGVFLSRSRFSSLGLFPVAPDGDLGVAGALSDRPLARGGPERPLEGLAAELFHRGAVEVGAGVHVHVLGEQLVAARGGDELYRRDEGEVGDRAVAGGEEDHVRARGDLSGDALQVVAGAVHEVEAALVHPLGVLDHAVDPHVGVLLHRGADGLDGDVVEPAVVVAPRRVVLGRVTVPARRAP